MSWNSVPPQNFGVSWGIRGLRIGRSQYGTWWISVGLPFGFRVTKRLGRLRDPVQTQPPSVHGTPDARSELPTMPHDDPVDMAPSTKNQKVLEQMRKRP